MPIDDTAGRLVPQAPGSPTSPPSPVSALEAVRVIVFAKAPLAGFAKTRLIPALGAEGAAALASRLLSHAVTQALAAQLGPVELCVAPDASHPAFVAWAQHPRVSLSEQGDGDLGERMARAFHRALGADRSMPVLLIGTDAPGLNADYLGEAARRLQGRDAVFGPALDGGYTLVGLRRPAPGLFHAMRWSTADVMNDTRMRLSALALNHAELSPLSDVDEPADLAHLPPDWAEESRPAP